MKKIKNLLIILLLFGGFCLVTLGLLYNHYTSSVSSDTTKKTVVVEKNMGSDSIGNLLLKNDLIKSVKVFKIYLKINKINDIKAGSYELSPDMNLGEIVEVLRKGNNYSNEEISITFKEGINMREVARVIASNTNNSYDDVMTLVSDKDYLNKLIEEYWFIDESILNEQIYYPLEGYLYPDTYRFSSKDVKIETIFEKLLKQMDKVLSKYKTEIEASDFSTHELLTLASIAEKEVNNKSDRGKVVSVFLNRLKLKMSLGSDVTTRYAIKLDTQRALTKKEYQEVNGYNTRSSTMAGKLPVGPICMISASSIEAAVNPADTEYLYFISNIQTDETFFFKYSSDFERKKQELSSVNRGY